MTSKELIRRVIEYDDPPRIGYDFNPPHERTCGGSRQSN